jgi:DmsE family decaheme c-type cytochrome
MFWDGSKHDSADVSCTSCHVIHTVGTERENMDTCLNCHKGVRRDIKKFSHHPLTEGKLKCSSCHNVHGSLGPSLMTKMTINELCYDCHTEKRGPFRFAHAPVEENCQISHKPHGTNAATLLTMNVRNLCATCHSYGSGNRHNRPNEVAAGGSAGFFMARQSCLGCHGEIHGGNKSYYMGH